MGILPRLAISAMRGGGGKTTLALGIISAWCSQGRRVSTFKKGPDFIDAGWLGAASHGPCYNLDLFMMEPERILESFCVHTAGADVAVIEGNRGLYDGVDEAGTYSTARLSQLLKTPVVLIADCTKASSTVGAMVLGCLQYDQGIDIKGVILNNVSSGRHENVVRNALEQRVGIPVVGAVPRLKKGEFTERHMGLTPYQEHPAVGRAIQAAASVAERYLDLEALWKIAAEAPELPAPKADPVRPAERGGRFSVGVIRDSAFQFYYPDNLEALVREGAEILEINALKDVELPELSALYIGGGFPETQAAALSANERLCRAIREAAEQGLPIYAECGGLIYLGRSLTVKETRYPMTAVLPVDFVLEERPQAHGYTILEAGTSSPFLDKGAVIRGHEFHYSRVVNMDETLPMAYAVKRGHGLNGRSDGFVYKNVVAAYTHIHAVATPEWAGALLRKAREYQLGQTGRRVVTG